MWRRRETDRDRSSIFCSSSSFPFLSLYKRKSSLRFFRPGDFESRLISWPNIRYRKKEGRKAIFSHSTFFLDEDKVEFSGRRPLSAACRLPLFALRKFDKFWSHKRYRINFWKIPNLLGRLLHQHLQIRNEKTLRQVSRTWAKFRP